MAWNGFHTDPVIGPQPVVLAFDGCIGPRLHSGQYSNPQANTTALGPVPFPVWNIQLIML